MVVPVVRILLLSVATTFPLRVMPLALVHPEPKSMVMVLGQVVLSAGVTVTVAQVAILQLTDPYSITGFDGRECNFSERPYCSHKLHINLHGMGGFVNLSMELNRRTFLSFAVITQVVFWLVALTLVLYVSSANLKPEHAL